MELRIDIKTTVNALYELAAKTLAPRPLNTVAATAATKVARRYFQLLDATRPNQLGGKRTHFWGKYAQYTHPFADENKASVVISDPVGPGQPLAAHYYGATITPTNSKFLTVPAIAAAHGVRARDYPSALSFALVGGKYPALVAEDNHGKKNRAGQVVYWLAKSITLQADESVLPPEAALLVEVKAALLRYLVPFTKGMDRGAYYA